MIEAIYNLDTKTLPQLPVLTDIRSKLESTYGKKDYYLNIFRIVEELNRLN